MKKTILAIACTALATPLVFAQATAFEGLSIGANLAIAKSNADFTSGGITLSTEGNTTGLDLQAQYLWAMGPNFVFGVGGTFGTGTNKAGNITAGGNSIDLSIKDRYSIDFIPGFAATKDLLVFGKISVLSGKGIAECVAGCTGNGSETLNGTGFGFGIRNTIDKNMYFQATYDINTYSEKDMGSGVLLKPKSTVLSLGVGYKF